MDSLTREEFDAFIPIEEALRYLHPLDHASMASDLIRGGAFAVPLTQLPRLGGPRAGRWTWSSKLTKKWLMNCTFSATSDRWQAC